MLFPDYKILEHKKGGPMFEPLRVVLVARAFVLNRREEILLIQRASNDNHHPGKWECPGGKVDERELLDKARAREILQETGFLTEPLSPITYVDDQIINNGKYKGFNHVRIFYVVRTISGKLRLSEEHQRSQWVPYHELISCDVTPETRRAAKALQFHLQ